MLMAESVIIEFIFRVGGEGLVLRVCFSAGVGLEHGSDKICQR